MEYRVVGENIRKYRKRLNLTQDQLADKVGVSWEMISRYERGESSPMNQLSNLANALGLSPSNLVDSEGTFSSQIPLFTNIPKDFVFKKENTLLFYNCPTWITKLDQESFVIDTEIVKTKSLVGANKGFLFVSPNCTVDSNDIVVVKDNKGLYLEQFSSHSRDVIGKLLMQEIVF